MRSITGPILLAERTFHQRIAGSYAQAPIETYRRALASGPFTELPGTKTLGVLRRR
jgi:hypothetical protein